MQFSSPLLSWDDFIKLVRRQLSFITCAVALGITSSLAAVSWLPVDYTATIALLMETRKLSVLRDAYPYQGGDFNDLELHTQIALLQSDAVILRALDKAPADTVARFIGRPVVWPTYLAPIAIKLGLGLVGERHPRRAAVNSIKKNLRIERAPYASVIHMSVTSTSPTAAADLANAIAEAYVEVQYHGRQEAAGRASAWLNGRVEEMRKLVQSSEEAEQNFKAAHNIALFGGQSLEDQRTTEINRQLLAVRAEVLQLEARSVRLQEIIGTPVPVVPSDLLADPLFAQLRIRQAALMSNEQQLMSKLNPNDEALHNVRQQKEQHEQVMRSEIQRLMLSIRSDIGNAKAREAKLAQTLEQLLREAARANEARIELREIERRNESNKAAYRELLQRQQAASQQQAFSDHTVQILAPAIAPELPDSRRPRRVLALGIALGLVVGGLGVLRVIADRSFRTPNQVRKQLDLASVWLLPGVRLGFPEQRMPTNGGSSAPHDPPVGSRLLPFLPARSNSDFIVALEAIKVDLDQRIEANAPVVGIASIHQGEGTTTVAANLAALLARAGGSTLLMDGDLKGKCLTKELASSVSQGLGELVRSGQKPADLKAACVEVEPRLVLLPASITSPPSYTADYLASKAVKAVLNEAREQFDYVVIDLPAIKSGNDVRAIAPELDALILVVAWGSTHRSTVAQTLYDEEAIGEKCFGVVLNKADLRRLN